MTTRIEREEEEGMDHGFRGLPLPKEREKMDVLKIAELLSSRPKGSPAYIVLEHELNLKIARLQAKATLNAGWISAVATILAVFIAFALGYFIGSSQTDKMRDISRKQQSSGEIDKSNKTSSTPFKAF